MAAFLLLLIASVAATAADDCSTWYETTKHGSAYRNVKDFGAKGWLPQTRQRCFAEPALALLGDGVTDDTAAFQAALTQGRTPTFTLKVTMFESNRYHVCNRVLRVFQLSSAQVLSLLLTRSMTPLISLPRRPSWSMSLLAPTSSRISLNCTSTLI